jgi:hypothetical protein
VRTGAGGLQTESGWEKWVSGLDEWVFDEKLRRRRRKAIVYIGRGRFSSGKLVRCTNREGFRMNMRLLVEGYVSLK